MPIHRPAANLLDVRRAESRAVEEVVAELGGALHKTLLDEHAQRLARHRHAERVAAVGRAVVAGLEHIHHLVVGENRRHRVHPAGQGLADDHDVRSYALVLVREELAGAAEAGLDLVDHEQHPVLVGELAQPAEVAVRRHHDPGLALDRLDQDGRDVGVHGGRHRIGVAVGQEFEAGCERPEARAVVGLGGEADDGRGAAVEVALEDQDLGLAVGHALDRVGPLAGGLDRGLDRLGPAVHGQHARKPGELRDLLAERSELVVAERPRGEADPARLPHHGRDQAGVAVALVDRRVGGEEVEVALALDVPHPGALGALHDHVQRMELWAP
jgi:hypothetical protein